MPASWFTLVSRWLLIPKAWVQSQATLVGFFLWAIWHWDRFVSEYFHFVLSVLSHLISTFVYRGRCYQVTVSLNSVNPFKEREFKINTGTQRNSKRTELRKLRMKQTLTTLTL